MPSMVLASFGMPLRLLHEMVPAVASGAIKKAIVKKTVDS